MFQSIFRCLLPVFLLLYGVGSNMDLQGHAADSAPLRSLPPVETPSGENAPALNQPQRPPLAIPKFTTPKSKPSPVQSQTTARQNAPTPDFLDLDLSEIDLSDSLWADFPTPEQPVAESSDLRSKNSADSGRFVLPKPLNSSKSQNITNSAKPLVPKIVPTFESSKSLTTELQFPVIDEEFLQKPTQKKRIEQILAEGTQYEKENLWSDAMRVYEKGLKTFADQPQILEKYRLCRYHYEIGRRYHDSTFEQLVKEAPLSEVLKIYTDVFSRIQSNHVDSPDWKILFGYGLDDLDIALKDDDFLKRNNIQVSADQLDHLRKKIRETTQPWSFRHIQDMKNGVICVAELAQNEIGLRPSAVLLEFVCGAAFGLDPHTSFLTLRQLNDFYSMIEGSFVGIGVELDTSDSNADVLTILKVHPNSPAMQAGLRDGDCILAVNGTQTTGLGLERAADLLQGEFGSTVVLQTRTATGKQREVRIVRREVEVASVEDVHLIDGSLGYIRINCFQTSTTNEMVSALDALQKQGMKSLILDLRHNPGGLLPVAVEVANLFLDDGIIVRTQDRNDESETVWRASGVGTDHTPLYVLIDEESASASEIFAGAIRDHKRGVLIGRQSYGKGTVQIIYRLSGNDSNAPISGLKLTVERFYSPEGLSFCNVGVLPDIVPSEEPVETVVLSKPDTTAGTLAQTATKKYRRITSSPDDPCVAEAIAASKHLAHSRP